ncbi:unnamed protein product [Schistocephalus solidus]|uniref:HMA domain-containing protein n=1 Tax=Schistocephalus solidus TaxID=70667 RepID=A0A183T938_SCHSO|nr:unnamed protein product [Schistocephalus solidus]
MRFFDSSMSCRFSRRLLRFCVLTVSRCLSVAFANYRNFSQILRVAITKALQRNAIRATPVLSENSYAEEQKLPAKTTCSFSSQFAVENCSLFGVTARNSTQHFILSDRVPSNSLIEAVRSLPVHFEKLASHPIAESEGPLWRCLSICSPENAMQEQVSPSWLRQTIDACTALGLPSALVEIPLETSHCLEVVLSVYGMCCKSCLEKVNANLYQSLRTSLRLPVDEASRPDISISSDLSRQEARIRLSASQKGTASMTPSNSSGLLLALNISALQDTLAGLGFSCHLRDPPRQPCDLAGDATFKGGRLMYAYHLTPDSQFVNQATPKNMLSILVRFAYSDTRHFAAMPTLVK